MLPVIRGEACVYLTADTSHLFLTCRSARRTRGGWGCWTNSCYCAFYCSFRNYNILHKNDRKYRRRKKQHFPDEQQAETLHSCHSSHLSQQKDRCFQDRCEFTVTGIQQTVVSCKCLTYLEFVFSIFGVFLVRIGGVWEWVCLVCKQLEINHHNNKLK